MPWRQFWRYWKSPALTGRKPTGFKVFPNPTSGFYLFQMDGVKGAALVQVFSLGQLVYSNRRDADSIYHTG